MKKYSVQIVFSQISITNIDTASGLFIGNNHSNNWSLHRKNNYGFGSLTHSSNAQNVGIVIDNDVVDAPIDDRDHFVNASIIKDSECHFQFENINVSNLNTSATINVGENDSNGWSSHNKTNSGEGKFIGSFTNYNNINQITDNDILDSPINDNDKMVNIQNG